MTDTFRALCAELTDALDTWLMAHHYGGVPPQDGADAELVLRARAALAQPEVQVLAHEAAARNAVESCLAQREEVLAAFIAKHGFCPDEAIQIEQRREDGSTTWRIERRAALAQPEPQGPSETAWALAQLLDGVQRHDLPNMTGLSDSDCDRIWAARWGRPAIEPENQS